MTWKRPLLHALLAAAPFLLAACSSQAPTTADVLTITGVTLHAAPGEVVQNATIVMQDGRVTQVSNDANHPVHGRHLDGSGLHASSGWWNAHVHLIDPNLRDTPQRVLDSMLLQRGFTQVVDTGSTLAETVEIRSSIAAGRLRGPDILLANGSFVYIDGTPSYLPGMQLPEVANAAAAAPMVNAVLDAGADGIKIFAGSVKTPAPPIHLPADVVAAIATAAHARGAFVFAHPTTLEGLRNSVYGGVNVIAHTTAQEPLLPAALMQRMRAQRTAVVPTLKLWRDEMVKFKQPAAVADLMENNAIAQLTQLHEAGVEILFGTDVGYLTDYDPTAEFVLMRRAGMDWPAMHRALTTAPAVRFGRGSGKVEKGAAADLVLFDGDPYSDPSALGRVAHTIIGGQVVYTAP